MSFRKYIKKGICNISISLSKYCVKKKVKKKICFQFFFYKIIKIRNKHENNVILLQPILKTKKKNEKHFMKPNRYQDFQNLLQYFGNTIFF